MLADPVTADRVAAATPVERDRFADLLRVASIGVVVAGHWLVAVVGWRDGRVEGGNAIALVPGLWLATWLLQVMPLFFFVGGLANLVSARRGGGWAGFVRGRAARLLRPTAAFLAVWTVAAAILGAAGVPEAVLRPATRLVVQPLWFLGLYLLVVALAPAMLRLHRRFGPAVAGWLALAAASADLSGVDRLEDLNFLLVWLFAHQLGFLYADGTLPGWPRRAHAAMAAGGLAALAGLTATGAWPASMVGLPGDRVSNMNPPSLCIVALTVWLVGLAMLVRDPVTRWLHRPRPWLLVVTAGSALMTLFLWHLTALVLAVLVLHPLGLTHPTPGTPTWWALRPLWLLVPTAMLVPLVAVFARFEHPGRVPSRPILPRRARSGPILPRPARSRPILPRPVLWIAAGTRFRRAVRSPSGGPSARPDRCLAATTGPPAAITGPLAAAIGTAAAAIGTAAVILGLLGVAVSGIWPLPGPTGDLAGIPINPAASLLALFAGMLLLSRSGRPSAPPGSRSPAPGRPEAPSPVSGPPEGERSRPVNGVLGPVHR